MLCSYQIVIILTGEKYRTIFQNLYKRCPKHDTADDTTLEVINTGTIPNLDELICKIKLSL